MVARQLAALKMPMTYKYSTKESLVASPAPSGRHRHSLCPLHPLSFTTRQCFYVQSNKLAWVLFFINVITLWKEIIHVQQFAKLHYVSPPLRLVQGSDGKHVMP